ncbi:meso-2,3-butanediol dehydrogenase [Sphingomonas immobilis]|uniref:SDR family NAD(P)-dependent oxidoreductase n=1 Tax=Sphingomonas immobilis TaxID=3063997 RepID=A0ABT9A0E9_9SPHN|nr:SDR family NAD(P)-dependent oxidoreductase [Sphingomonas sp. CA1-15]MDO7842167.1 SDR family NAD(P)-dependent oxidoreductase [Sphingomonas sp. CA1-15]
MTEPLGSMRRFAGKVVAITGAASGIGAATATRFAAEGARLALCDLAGDRLAAFAEGLALAPADLFLKAVDVADGAAVEAFVEAAAAALGGLDVLVNNAGIGCFGHVDEITPEAWRKTMAVDLDAVFFGCRAALPHLRRSRGAIVNTASISGQLADAGLVAYNVAKAGVINLTRNLAVDHAADGIRANCICPGGVGTPMLTAHMRDAAIMAEYERLVPLGRVGTPEEMAAAITFLASADAAYITGVALTVDGGVTAQTGQPNFDRLYRERDWDKKILARKP